MSIHAAMLVFKAIRMVTKAEEERRGPSTGISISYIM
jgi:hypothetical protein